MTSGFPPTDRYRAVFRVLFGVLLLNIAVALAKLVLGYATGAVSVISDGFHSLTDSASNIIGMVGLRASRKPPDEDHPYGHRKYETLAAAGIFIFLLFVVIEVARAAFDRLSGGHVPEVGALSFAVMVGTLGINLFVVRYESGRGRALNSELLLADAMHTKSDVFTSCAVIVSLVAVRSGYPILDPVGGLIIAVFIARTGWEIARDTSRILSDRVVLAEDETPRRRDERARGCRVPSDPLARISGSHVPRPARLVRARHDALRGPPAVARRQGPADGEVPADRRRDHPHRTATGNDPHPLSPEP